MNGATVAVIPARGGSKGIPGKNLRPFRGLPLIAHSILQAAEAASVDEVFVSTDDPRIAQVSRRWGAEVVERPAELAADAASSESALRHALETLEKGWARRPELVVFLQCTSPLRTPAEIDGAVARLLEEERDSLLSVVPLHGLTWHGAGDDLEPAYDVAARPRRQDLAAGWVENGSIYVFRRRTLSETGHRLGGRVGTYETHPLSYFQIDEPGDLELVERLAPLHPWRPRPRLVTPIRLLVLDFDGVLTDDRVWVDGEGREAVACHRGDGFGIERLGAAGVEVAVLSKETDPVVAARCRKLGIECRQGEDDKLPALRRWAELRDLEAAQVAYVGNDLNDLECLGWAGLGVAVADARPELLDVADWITTAAGGRGAVREVCDLLLEAAAREEP